MPEKTSDFATLLGIVALFFWSVSALLIMFIGKLPIFELQTIVFSMSFTAALIYFGPKRLLKTIQSLSLIIFITGTLGIFCNNFFFIMALKHAPAEKADLINYLWPVMAVLFSFVLPKEKLKTKHILGAFLAFYGIYILLTNGCGLQGFEICYWKGYLFALIDALCWAIFTVSLRHYQKSPVEIMGIFCGMTAVLSLIGHLSFETFIAPSYSQLSFILLLALTSQCASYFLWDHGIKKGHYHLLCIISYFNPIISIALLVLFGFVEYTENLMFSTLLVSLGAYIASEANLFVPIQKGLRISWRGLGNLISPNA